MKTLTWIAALIVLVAVHAAGTWSLPLLDRDEPRFAEASREMNQRGDRVVPYFNNAPRLAKPPAIYWCQSFCYRLFGENEFAARFPSVLAAALTALLIFLAARRMYDHDVAMIAAVSFSVSLQTLYLAKAATADMLLVLCVTAAGWAAWEMLTSIRKGEETVFWWLFYASLTLGFLVKGPVAWLPLAAVIIHIRRAGTKDLLARFRPEWGLTMMLALIAVWGLPALIRTDGEFFRVGIGENVIGRSFYVMEGHGGEGFIKYFRTLPYYFVTVFFSFFPWSIFLVPMTLYFVKGFTRVKTDTFLWTLTAVFFIVFTPLKTKLPHYTYPAFPFLSILFARYWMATGWPLEIWRRMAVLMGVTVVLMTFAFFPMIAHLLPSHELWRKSESTLSREMEFATVDYNEPSLVWEFRRTVSGWHHAISDDQAVAFMQKKGPRFIVFPSEKLAALFPSLDRTWLFFSASGARLAKGKNVDLTMIVKP